MRSFDEIYAIAADRKGGAEAIEARLSVPLSSIELAATQDDRWLSAMAKCLFQAGFNWKVIDAKWPGTEEAFDGFDPARVQAYHDDDIDRLLSDKRIVRNGAKVMAVIENARFIQEIKAECGSAGAGGRHNTTNRSFARSIDSEIAACSGTIVVISSGGITRSSS